MYGTSKKAARTVVDAGKICILDIDMEGVKQIKASPELGSPMYAFIKPPSMEVLEARLRGRKTETEEALKRRLDKAREELAYGEEPGNLDVATVNDTTLFTADNLQTRIVNTNWLTCSSLPDFARLLLLRNLKDASDFFSAWWQGREFDPQSRPEAFLADKPHSYYYILHTAKPGY